MARGGSWKPELYTIDSVVNFYNQYDDIVAWRIYQGTSPQPQYARAEYGISDGEIESGSNKNEGSAELANMLQILKSNVGNTNIYCLQLVRNAKRKNTKKGEGVDNVPYLQVNFQLNNDYFGMVGNVPQQVIHQPTADNTALAAILEKLNNINERLNKIEEEEEEEEEEEKPVGFIGAITKMLDNPAVQQQLISGVMNMFNNSGGVPKGIAGIPETTNLDTTIAKLKKLDDNLNEHLYKLCWIAENDKMLWNLLIKQLDSINVV